MAFSKGYTPWNKGKKIEVSRHSLKNLVNFKKGYTPWNKGKKGGTAGSFKKGDRRLLGNKFGFKKGQEAWNKGIKGRDSHSFGHENYVKDKRQRIRNGILGRLALQIKKGPTNLEKIVYDFLKGRGIYFKSQELINGRFLVDAYIPQKNLIIECDGNYWHSLGRVKKKDKAENAYLNKCGFNVLRLKEEEILNGEYKGRILKWR